MHMVEIEVILDEHYVDPRVTIRTRANTPQVENIIIAIENVSNSDYPQIAAMKMAAQAVGISMATS